MKYLPGVLVALVLLFLGGQLSRASAEDSAPNADQPYGVKHLREVFNRRITLRGFVLSDHRDQFEAACSAWLAA